MAEPKRTWTYSQRVSEDVSNQPRIAPRSNATWYQVKSSLKPVSYSQVKGFFQDEEFFERRKVPQALHWSGAISLACQPIFCPQAGQARRN